MNRPAEIPPVPKYIQEWESPFGAEAALPIRHHGTLSAMLLLGGKRDKDAYLQTDVDLLETLATEAGIAKGTLYLYFPGKQELFFACVDWGMSWMQQTVRAAAESTPEPMERIAVAIRAYLAFFEEHAEYVELVIQERAIFRDRKQPTYFEYRAANLGYWKDLYAQLIAAGRFFR